MKLNNPELLRSQCLINGEWCDALSGKREAVINPATGVELASIPLVSGEETQQAINAAQVAQQGWKQLTAKQRSALLLAWADKVLAAQEDLAQLMTAEQGKSLAEARGEVAYAASFITWFAEEAKRVDGAVLQAPLASQRLVVVKQPIGVCAAITPWNFPAAMITRKVAPALAAGCAIIVKPAEQTPLTALALGKLAQDAGIPAGVLQVVTGDAAQVGKVLCDSPVVRKLSFTGSTEVGRILMAQCAPTIKKLSLELGGNAPVIVFDDANLDAAVAGIMASKFRNSGQTCVCANRIYVQDGIYDRLVDKLVAAGRTTESRRRQPGGHHTGAVDRPGRSGKSTKPHRRCVDQGCADRYRRSATRAGTDLLPADGRDWGDAKNALRQRRNLWPGSAAVPFP